MSQDLDDLIKWLDQQKITRQKKNLNRDFSDAIPLVEILKFYYPKLVDMHNYSSKCAIANKLANWEVLNKKVLNKLDINLSLKDQEQLAKSSPGAIESLLWKIKKKIENQHVEEKNSIVTEQAKVYYLEGISNMDVIDDVVPLKVQCGTKIIDQCMLSADMYEKMQKNLNEQMENINILKDRVLNLEHIIIVKDERIDDLNQKLQTMITGHGDNTNPTGRTRFFGRLF